MERYVEVVVIGAGQGGLGSAKMLSDAGLDVVVLERGQIGETWLSQRWESFALNTPNWMNGLPGSPYVGEDPDGFMSHLELVESFHAYVDAFGIDVRTGVNVTRVARSSERPDRFTVESEVAHGPMTLHCSHVVLASGIAQSPRIPPMASRFPEDIIQLSTSTYRSPQHVADGAVLVVGGGQSGGQIVEDLLGSDRSVYFSISNVGRVPRRYRGRDFMDWMVALGIWDIPTSEADPDLVRATNPLTSGVGPRGHTISFQQLASDGAHLMGRLEDVVDGVVSTDDRVMEYVRSSDEFSRDLKDKIDGYIAEIGIEAEDPEPDPADQALADGAEIDFETRLDLAAVGVRTVIWCTGFGTDFSWVDLPITDHAGHPIHARGVGNVPGIYFIGHPWLSTRKSGVIYGIEQDAEHIAKTITATTPA